MNNKKVVFYLMNDKGLYCLKNLLTQDIVAYVVTSKDKGTFDESYENIMEYCKNKNINCYNRENAPRLNGNNIVIAIGWKWIIDFKSLIVLHDSLLPKYRGFNPTPTALIKGDTKLGVTALYATEVYDTGDIIFQRSTKIEYPCKIQEAIDNLKVLYSEIINLIIEYIQNNKLLPRKPQNHLEATYSLWRDEDDYRIDWTQSNKYIQRFVDALGYPYKGAMTLINGYKYRILDVENVEDVVISNRDCGKVIFKEDGYPIIVCGKGLLKVIKMVDNKGTLIDLKTINIRTRFE